MSGKMDQCQVYKDHFIRSKYQSHTSSTLKSAAAKTKKTIGNFISPTPPPVLDQPTTQSQNDFDYVSDSENLYEQDLDPNYESTETEEDEDDSKIELMLKCPNTIEGKTTCDATIVHPKYFDYLPDKDISYEMTDVIWTYVNQMKDEYQKPDIGVLSSTDLDMLHQNTQNFDCSDRRLITEISKLNEISKLQHVEGSVSLILVLFGHPNMRRKHTMYCGQTERHNNDENRKRAQRSTPGHFITCHVNPTSGVVSIFDSLNCNPGDFTSLYFCDTARVSTGLNRFFCS